MWDQQELEPLCVYTLQGELLCYSYLMFLELKPLNDHLDDFEL